MCLRSSNRSSSNSEPLGFDTRSQKTACVQLCSCGQVADGGCSTASSPRWAASRRSRARPRRAKWSAHCSARCAEVVAEPAREFFAAQGCGRSPDGETASATSGGRQTWPGLTALVARGLETARARALRHAGLWPLAQGRGWPERRAADFWGSRGSMRSADRAWSSERSGSRHGASVGRAERVLVHVRGSDDRRRVCLSWHLLEDPRRCGVGAHRSLTSSGPNSAKIGRLPPKFAPMSVDRISSECCQFGPEVGQIWERVRSKLAQSRPILGNLGRVLTDLGQCRLGSATNAEFGQNLPTFDQILAISAKVELLPWYDFCHKRPGSDQMWAFGISQRGLA